MTKNRRSTNLLAAGTMMGLLVATFFLFDSGSLQKVLAAQFSGMSLLAEESTTSTSNLTLDQGLVTTLQAQNSALSETIETLQAREVAYRATIQKANQTLQQFVNDSSAKLADANGAASTVAQNNEALRQAVQTLQDRENQYRTELDTANQSIHQLEAAVQQRQVGMETLQSQNAELVKAVQLMQERERQYQEQLQIATQAAQSNNAQQQASSNSNNSNNSGGYSEHEDHDDD